MIELASASELSSAELATLVTRVYEGYWHPIVLDAAGLERIVALYDLDLDASVVALAAGEPIGVALLGRRGADGWVGGMGVVADRRGAGLGARLTVELLDRARERAVGRVRLEVLEQNAPAIAVYERLGFAALRDVGLWRLEHVPPGAAPATDAELDTALAALAAEDAPWQRAVATIERMREHGTPLVAVAAGDGFAVHALAAGQASLLGIVAEDETTARALLAAPFARDAQSVLWLNGPTESPTARVLGRERATLVALQHELVLQTSG